MHNAIESWYNSQEKTLKIGYGREKKSNSQKTIYVMLSTNLLLEYQRYIGLSFSNKLYFIKFILKLISF